MVVEVFKLKFEVDYYLFSRQFVFVSIDLSQKFGISLQLQFAN